MKIEERTSAATVDLNPKLYEKDVEQEAIRVGFGRGLVAAGRRDPRVVALCAGELPFAAQRTCDLEVWMPGMRRYVEISSISDCGPFQARRLRLRYRPFRGGRARHPHTLNGSALAIGRTIAALLENGQHANGSVTLPAALQPYMRPLVLARQPV